MPPQGATMCLQTSVLNQYKQAFPSHKLKETAGHTGIQISRLFRVLNGSEMKLKEYEAFEACLSKEMSTNEFILTAKECLEKLNPNRKKLLHAQMKKALKLHFLQSALDSNLLNQDQLA